MKKLLLILPLLVFGIGALNAQNEKIAFDIVVKSEKENTPPLEMTFYIDGKQMAAESTMQGNNMRIIFKQETKEIITLMDINGQKMGMKTSVPVDQVMESVNNEKDEYKVTGNKKNINGYNTREVVLNHGSGGKSELWLTNDIDFDYFKAMKVFDSGNSNDDRYAKLRDAGVTGFPMVIKNYDEDGELMITTEAKNIKKDFDKGKFSTEGYTISEMPGR